VTSGLPLTAARMLHAPAQRPFGSVVIVAVRDPLLARRVRYRRLGMPTNFIDYRCLFSTRSTVMCRVCCDVLGLAIRTERRISHVRRSALMNRA
jgi:hypothetical protein